MDVFGEKRRFAWLVLGIFFAGCAFTPEEISRATSPDSALDAVFGEASCGAGCPFIYHVSIVPKGAPAAEVPEHDVFTATDVVGLELNWVGPRTLEIAYDSARVSHFEEEWTSKGRGTTVELRLRRKEQPGSAVWPHENHSN